MAQDKPLKECQAGDDVEMGRVEYYLEGGKLIRLAAGIAPYVFNNPAEFDSQIEGLQKQIVALQEAKAEYVKLISG